MLSGYLGADYNTRGLAKYRLLDAEVVFFSDLPKVHQTARYDIKILRFFHHGTTLMFRFEFDGTIGGVPLLSMRQGCAGFFTSQALAAGRGLATPQPEKAPQKSSQPLIWANAAVKSLSAEDVTRLRHGDLSPLGQTFASLPLKNPLSLPGGKLALFETVPRLERQGGLYGQGFIRSQAAIDPQAWFLKSHFPGDEVMPGTLMFDACLQTLRLFLMSLGWVGQSGEVSWQPPLNVNQSLKCRGQVTVLTKEVFYDVHIRELTLAGNEPLALAEAIMWADGRPIVEVRNLGLRFTSPADRLASLWKTPAPPKPSGFGETFDKKRLTELTIGRMSKALGPLFARFDDGSFCARLPRDPYDFVDLAAVQGRIGEVAVGTSVEAAWEPRNNWIFGEAGGKKALPYAALNEIALQACGFLSSFMGTALLFDEPMYFRNLGGEAKVSQEIFYSPEPIKTQATLTKSSVLGQMTIQHYSFVTTQFNKVIYEGQTHFGFFNKANLSNQRGLKIDPKMASDLKRPARPQTIPYPQGPSWPEGHWVMLEDLFVGSDNQKIWAQSSVNPKAWFFKAHFPGDPVWPGSLGLEAFIQAAKYLTARRYHGHAPFKGCFISPVPGISHSWLYRGQIPPTAKEMSLGLMVTNSDPHQKILTFSGLLAVDNLIVYQVDNFSVGLGE
jgi:3-hydroxymyristoyl/3-hydroxydecanoyl-(acyl carrier protein) dehydratase